MHNFPFPYLTITWMTKNWNESIIYSKHKGNKFGLRFKFKLCTLLCIKISYKDILNYKQGKGGNYVFILYKEKPFLKILLI